jgi:hypothetical protein
MSAAALTSEEREESAATRPPTGPRSPYPGRLFDSLSLEDQVFLLDYIDVGSTRKLAAMGKRHKFAGVSSSSSVSRRFIKISRQLVTELNGRSLEHVNLAAIMLDGTGMGAVRPKRGKRSERRPKSRAIVWALGITVDGRKVLLGAVEGQSESKVLVRKLFKQLAKQKLDLRDALLVTDGGAAFDGINMAHQRCLLHKGRNVAWQKLSKEERNNLSKEIYRKLKHALATANRNQAREELIELARWMEEQGLDQSATALLTDLDQTLALLDLVPDDPEIRTAFGTTNQQEGAHDALSEWEDHIKRWSRPLDREREGRDPDHLDDRLRHFAAPLAVAELSWKQMRLSRPSLENLTLAVMRRRHPHVELNLVNSPGRLTLTQAPTRPPHEVQWQSALRDTVRWADRNGKTLVIEGPALESLPRTVNAYLRKDVGFVARQNDETNSSELRRLPQSPWSCHLRGAVDDRLIVAVADAALELAPDFVWLDEPDLETAASRLGDLRTELGLLEHEIDGWSKVNFLRAAKKVALERIAIANGERPRAEPIGEARWRLLGNRRAEWLMGHAVHFEGKGHDASRKSRDQAEVGLGDPFVELDAIQARLNHVARAVAASQELSRRRELTSLTRRRAPSSSISATRAPDHGAPKDAVGPIARRIVALGSHNQKLLQPLAKELAKKLFREDTRTLLAIRKNHGTLWKEPLDGTKILKTKRYAEDAQQSARREFNAQVSKRGPRDKRNREAWESLREVDDRRSIESFQAGGLDAFMTEYGFDAAIDDAIDHVLTERARENGISRVTNDVQRGSGVDQAAAETVPAAPVSTGLEI